MKRITILLGLAALAAVSGPAIADNDWSAAEISRAQVRARLAADTGSLVVLDVRTPEEYAAGHVPGAINVPYDQIASRLAELEASRERPIVVYCRTGRRAGIALQTLHDAGFIHLMHLTGDLPGWAEKGE